jgi:hypothetical protein
MNSGTKMWMVIVIIVLSLVAAGMSTLTWLNTRKGNRMNSKMGRRAYAEIPETDDTPEDSPEE